MQPIYKQEVANRENRHCFIRESMEQPEYGGRFFNIINGIKANTLAKINRVKKIDWVIRFVTLTLLQNTS